MMLMQLSMGFPIWVVRYLSLSRYEYAILNHNVITFLCCLLFSLVYQWGGLMTLDVHDAKIDFGDKWCT